MNKDVIEIGAIAASLMEEPTIKTEQYFEKLLNYCKNKDNHTARVAIRTFGQVLADLLPSYPVGKHAQNETLSKEVIARRKQESLLQDFDRRYTQVCERIAFDKSTRQSLKIEAARGLCQLLSKKPQFHTGNYLPRLIVRLCDSKVDKIREIAAQEITSIFQNDPHLTESLRLMTEVAQTPTQSVSVDLLESMLNLDIRRVIKQEENPDDKVDDPQLRKELKQAGIIDNRAETERNKSFILEHLFGTVFRFLKETKSEEHFFASMEILRKFVDLINIEFVHPILDALKNNRFSMRASITAAQTALELCKTAKLNVDLHDFFSNVYSRSFESAEDKDALAMLSALFDVISGSINKTRTYAFMKRLLTLALHSNYDFQALVLCQIRLLFSKMKQLNTFIDFEFQSGDYKIEAKDPDFCGAEHAKFWELGELAHSPNPIVADLSREILKLTDYDAINEADLEAAKQKKVYKPIEMYEMLDDSMRIYDVKLLEIPVREAPKSFKTFNFDE